MGFKVNTNIDSLNAYYNLAKVNNDLTKSQLRIASGSKLQHVSDDTSGFNVGNSLKGKVKIMEGAQGNISAAKDLLSTAESNLLGINDLLTKIEGKLSDSTNPTADPTAIGDDIKALAQEIDSKLKSTKFNNTQLLYSTAGKGFVFQVGEASDTLKLDFASSLACTNNGGYDIYFSGGLTSFINISTSYLTSTSGGEGGLTSLRSGLASMKAQLSTALGKIGNFTQRLEIKEETLNTSIANAKSSISRIYDTDMAWEQLNAMRGTILQQSATSMFAQLNMAPQQVLQLFG
ncbi:MAG TPA: flagellin [Melioribacteraceae bacterium]|nr:flagellin [Melioribacteraceae bacterium]